MEKPDQPATKSEVEAIRAEPHAAKAELADALNAGRQALERRLLAELREGQTNTYRLSHGYVKSNDLRHRESEMLQDALRARFDFVEKRVMDVERRLITLPRRPPQ